jgi:choline-sulfatase
MTGGCAQARPSAQPNILLVTIDTFRADRLGVGVAPALDALAASSLRFTHARTAVPLTLPSHATIMTGLLPPRDGVRENGVDALGAEHPTIARLLRKAGYRTAAFVGAFVLDHRFGLAQGFDTYDDQIARDPNASERLEAERPASEVVDRALAWLDRTKDSAPSPQPPAPFFVWIHLYDPHAPYTPPARFAGRTRTPYDGEVAFADEQIARVFEWLRAHGQMNRTLIVVAGDHGEGLGDHGERTHGMLLYDSTLRVPLIVAAPGRPPAQAEEAVSLVDVAPTILRFAGAGPSAEMKGRDLLESVRSGPDTTGTDSVRLQPDRDLYSETEYPHVLGWSPLQALTDGRWMTIRAGAATEVYDLLRDPLEQHNVAGLQARIAAVMSLRAQTLHGASAASGSGALSIEAQERLRSLGYVASSAQPPVGSDAPNPATRIATWNAFEGALAAIGARQPGALAAIRRLAVDNPDAPVIHTTLARALKDDGQSAAALTAYREAAKRWPTDAALFRDLAATARQAAAGKTGADAKALRDEAVRADEAAVAIDPNSGSAQNTLGLLAIERGQPDAAARAFGQATKLDPGNALYWANLGNASRATGDRAGAEQAYRRALDTDPRTVDAANGLGVLMVEAQRPADAVPIFEQALAVAPDFAEARLNLGIALQSAGKSDLAAAQYRQILAASGHPREKDAATKLLAAMGELR